MVAMPRFRFSLLTLFGFVAAMAVVCAALARPTMLWVTVIQGFAFGCLFFSVLAAIYGQRSSRAFWVGFAVVGWGYIGAQQFLLIDVAERPTLLISSHLQTLIHPTKTTIGGVPVTNGRGQPLAINGIEINAFLKVVGWLWPLLLGFIGGMVSRHLYLRRERAAQEVGTSRQQH
jgi:hypothetical protein